MKKIKIITSLCCFGALIATTPIVATSCSATSQNKIELNRETAAVDRESVLTASIDYGTENPVTIKTITATSLDKSILKVIRTSVSTKGEGLIKVIGVKEDLTTLKVKVTDSNNNTIENEFTIKVIDLSITWFAPEAIKETGVVVEDDVITYNSDDENDGVFTLTADKEIVIKGYEPTLTVLVDNEEDDNISVYISNDKKTLIVKIDKYHSDITNSSLTIQCSDTILNIPDFETTLNIVQPTVVWSDPIASENTGVEISDNAITYTSDDITNGVFTITSDIEIVTNDVELTWTVLVNNYKVDNISVSLGSDKKTLTVTIDKYYSAISSKSLTIQCTGAVNTVPNFTSTLTIVQPIISWSDPVAVAGTNITISGTNITYANKDVSVNGQFTIVASDAIIPTTSEGISWKIYCDGGLDSLITASLESDMKTLTISVSYQHEEITNKSCTIVCVNAAQTINEFNFTLTESITYIEWSGPSAVENCSIVDPNSTVKFRAQINVFSKFKIVATDPILPLDGKTLSWDVDFEWIDYQEPTLPPYTNSIELGDDNKTLTISFGLMYGPIAFEYEKFGIYTIHCNNSKSFVKDVVSGFCAYRS